MKKILAAAGIGAALLTASMAATGTASAYTGAEADATFIGCTSANGIYNPNGPAIGAAYGRQIANDIQLGLRDPLAERNYVYQTTSASVTVIDANVLVNCATGAYLGYGPNSTPPPADNSSGGNGTLAW